MKTALITGATDGIGKALAQKLLVENWTVVIIGRNEVKVEKTITELKSVTGKNSTSGITADLSLLSDTRRAVEKFLSRHHQLDALILNANAISNTRIITTEGNEQNFSVGYLSRVLMIQLLQETLEKTENSQILSVMGRSWARMDFEDVTIEKEFTGWKGLTRWQWAFATYMKYFAENSTILANLYSPGLVKTKILSNEPQPMRLMVMILNKIIGLTPDRSAENIYKVVCDVVSQKQKGRFYEFSKNKGAIKVVNEKGDFDRLNTITGKILG